MPPPRIFPIRHVGGIMASVQVREESLIEELEEGSIEDWDGKEDGYEFAPAPVGSAEVTHPWPLPRQVVIALVVTPILWGAVGFAVGCILRSS